MVTRFALIGTLLALAGCAALTDGPDAGSDRPEARMASDDETRPSARPDSAQAEGAPAEVAAATPPGVLGRTVASLGDPTQGGAWLVTGLVSQTAAGQVTDLATGAQAQVELRPSGAAPGAGSRLSLAGFQALGLPLTALPDLQVSCE